MTVIDEWFEKGCPFQEGVELFRTSSSNTRLLKLFAGQLRQAYVSDYFREKLKNELRKLSHQKQPIPHTRSSDTPPAESKDPAPEIQVQKQLPQKEDSDEPAEIKRLRDEAKKLHKAHSYLHSQLSSISEIGERHKVARYLVTDILPSLDKIYDDIRHWDKTGILPIDIDPRVVKYVVELFQKRSSVRSSISHLKRRMKKATEKSRIADIELMIEEKIIELSEIERKLGI